MVKIKATRGMNDILPNQTPYWQFLEMACREVAEQHGYHEVRFPIVEYTQLFQRTIGEATDIVDKEMYTFADRHGDSITLRPEGTAGCVRAGLEHSLLQQTQRWWYCGPMFRYERPQKGRYRQFYHFGIEAFGMTGPEIDAEHLLMNRQLWRRLGLEKQVQLQINNLGSLESRDKFRTHLVDYFKKSYELLDEDSKRRLEINPLRILDSKNPAMQSLIENAPKLLDYADDASRAHFDRLLSLLDSAGVSYVINPRLVRGLDYYGLTVFEWVTQELGAQGTVSAGGRYDRLVAELGGSETPAVGFAFGLDRIVLLLEKFHPRTAQLDIHWVCVGEEAVKRSLLLAEKFHQDLPKVKIEVNLTGGNFKNQFKRADKSGARWALILAEDELKSNKISIKDLRTEAPQQQMSYEELVEFLKE